MMADLMTTDPNRSLPINFRMENQLQLQSLETQFKGFEKKSTKEKFSIDRKKENSQEERKTMSVI